MWIPINTFSPLLGGAYNKVQKLFAEMIVVESLDVREIWETVGDDFQFKFLWWQLRYTPYSPQPLHNVATRGRGSAEQRSGLS